MDILYVLAIFHEGKRVMEFEVLKRSYLKRCIIIGVIAVLVISAIILTFTRAKYRSVADMPIVSGTINYSLADFNAVAMYLDGKSIDILPEGQYNLTQESYCEVNGVRDDSITLNYDSSTHSLTLLLVAQLWLIRILELEIFL